MKANKIIATLVVLTMLLSTLVVFNQLNVVNQASAQPGVDNWGYAKTELIYGVTYSSVNINTSTWSGSSNLYLYYPNYKNTGAGPNADTFTWEGPYKVGGISAFIDVNDIGKNSAPLDTGGSAITFNRSGIWIFDDNIDHTTYAGYIWVNSSTVYSIQSISNFDYGSAGTLTVTVETGDDTGCMIAITDPDNNTIYHKWRSTGVSDSIKIDTTNFTYAGDYWVHAYRDFDLQDSMYLYKDEGGAAYSPYYGSGFSPMGDYDWNSMGPWDPPEKNATSRKFTVNTGKPNIVLTNTSIYWGFETRIDINVTDNEGEGIDDVNAIILRYGTVYFGFFGFIYNEPGKGNYSIQIPRFDDDPTGWNDLRDAVGGNVNGTWRVYFAQDNNVDGMDEWNNSATFVIKSASPPVQIVIVNPATKKVNVPTYPDMQGYAETIDIIFDIFGTSINNVEGRAYYGDDPWEDSENITVDGDILYPATLVHNTKGRWTATLTPTKPGGKITITIDWPGSKNGTATQTIDIVNGTHVTTTVDSFTVGADYNLTVKVIDMDGDSVKNANVYLMWEDFNLQFNKTTGNNQVGNGLNGEYTFWIKPHKKDSNTPNSAPHNITIAAQWYTGYWGYTNVIMERNHNMRVNVTPTASYAGDRTEYDITVSLLEGGNPATAGLTVALYNETGVRVTGDDAWSVTSKYSILGEELILSGGTYYIYAYNATHDSQGSNATIVITKYAVASSPSVLAWKVDKEVNMTFQVTPAGDGLLSLHNMSALPNASAVGQSYQITIEDGIGSLDGVNASTLGNVTFEYTPEGGHARAAEGLLRVTTATATPNPATIYLGEATMVTITITHPATGTPLQGVEVGLDLNKNITTTLLSKLPANLFTNAQGQVTFAITAEGSGNITIFIENETDPDNPFVIIAAGRKQMTISHSPSVNEGATFTIEAKSNDVLITDATVIFTFDGQTWPTTTGVATITAPSVATSMSYPITAIAEGYFSASSTIMVVNVPKLIIAIAGEVKTGQSFTVTIADDKGGPVIGATVTFEGKTYTTGAGGVVTITAPSTAGNYPMTASFPGYQTETITVTVESGGGIPGFELLTLIAAIGVAFLLLRRRRK